MRRQRANEHGVGHWMRLAVLAALGFVLAQYVDEHHRWTDIRYEVTQKMHDTLARHPLYPKRTAIVLIDDGEYWNGELAGRSPVKRDYLAKLVCALSTAGAEVIALDFDLRSPKPDGSTIDFPEYLKETTALVQSIKEAVAAKHKVVLATGVGPAPDGDGYAEQSNVYDKQLSSELSKAEVQRGFVQLPYDVRQVPVGIEDATNLVTHEKVRVESFAAAIVKTVDPVAYTRIAKGADELPFADYIAVHEFEKPEDGAPRLLKASLLLSNLEAARKVVGGKIVIVSGNWNSRAFEVGPRVDSHASPVGSVPGAIIHANYVEAMLSERTFSPIPEWLVIAIEGVALVFLAYVTTLGLSAWADLAAVVTVTLFFLVTSFFLQDVGKFFDFFVPLVILFGHLAVEKVLEWRKAAHEERAYVHAA